MRMNAKASPDPDRTATAPSVRVVRCPSCAGVSVFAPSNPYRPFCSARCKNLDLGAWASERFAVPAAPDPELGG
ncbi:MAG: hypothetical protein Fur007_07820 [Rhodoferax sp.]